MYSIGHTGKFGAEFLKLEVFRNGRVRYTNCSGYKRDGRIEKDMYVSQAVLDQLRKMVIDSGITSEDDAEWPLPDQLGKQELEVICGNEHISFQTCKIGSLLDISESRDPEGLKVFYYLMQDVKCLILSLIRMHSQIKPI